MFPPAWAVACMYVNVHFVPIFFPAGGVNASAGVLFNIYSTYIVVQCRLYTPAKYFVSNSWNSKNMPLLQIPTTQFSTTIRELDGNKVIIFACCWPDSWVDRPRDRNYKICKFKNTYTQDNKLFQIIGQIHGAMLLNIDPFTLSCCY